MHHDGSPEALSTVDFEYLQSLLRQKAALVLESGKTYLAEARLLPLARREGCTSVGELLGRLRAAPRPLQPDGSQPWVVGAAAGQILPPPGARLGDQRSGPSPGHVPLAQPRRTLPAAAGGRHRLLAKRADLLRRRDAEGNPGPHR